MISQNRAFSCMVVHAHDPVQDPAYPPKSQLPARPALGTEMFFQMLHLVARPLVGAAGGRTTVTPALYSLVKEQRLSICHGGAARQTRLARSASDGICKNPHKSHSKNL